MMMQNIYLATQNEINMLLLLRIQDYDTVR